jgi:fluoroquinolone resistance protein
MQTALNNEKAYLTRIFKNLTETNTEISGVEFEGCEFHECNFTETTFRKCRFIECTFSHCNLSVIKVPQSKFSDVVFKECKLVGVDWTKAAWPKLAFSVSLKMHNCIINDSSFFGLKLDEIVIKQCKAHDVDFRDGSFVGADFSYTDFTDCLFAKTILSGADFYEAINFDIDIFNNNIKKARFSRYEAARLLNSLDIELVD